MKLTLRSVFALSVLGAALSGAALAAEQDAGFVDFGKFKPTEGAQFVEVNVSGNIIEMVTALARKHEPEVADALKGLKRIRVNVLGLTPSNREEIQAKVKQVREELTEAGWERMVTAVQEDQDVGVYVKTRGSEAFEGIVVAVLNGKEQAVFVNVVGDIRPEKLAIVGERFDIEPLKKLKAKKQS